MSDLVGDRFSHDAAPKMIASDKPLSSVGNFEYLWVSQSLVFNIFGVSIDCHIISIHVVIADGSVHNKSTVR